MRKLFALAVASLLCGSVFLFQGCLKDSYTRTHTYTYYKPLYKTADEVRANIRTNTPLSIEKPGKIFVRGQYIFLNEVDKGIHVIDNSNPSQPRNIAFIAIPGNMDMAVKGNILYADLYTDLVAIDITDPQNVVVKKKLLKGFSHTAIMAFHPIRARSLPAGKKGTLRFQKRLILVDGQKKRASF